MKLKKSFAFMAAASLAVIACGHKKSDANLRALLEREALVVDVRTPAEFASGHHPRAVNIPVDQVEGRLAEFGDKTKPVVVYCGSGVRSGRAKETLEAAGFTQVTNAGGFRDLP
jgi:phage shock protein E